MSDGWEGKEKEKEKEKKKEKGKGRKGKGKRKRKRGYLVSKHGTASFLESFVATGLDLKEGQISQNLTVGFVNFQSLGEGKREIKFLFLTVFFFFFFFFFFLFTCW